MEIKKLVQATAIVSALGGLYGCSGDEDVDIVIDAPTTVTNPPPTGGGGEVDCPAAFSSARAIGEQTVCQLDEEILSSQTLTSDITWYLRDRVVVGNGNQAMSATDGTLESGDPVADVTLTIEAGTNILGRTNSFANLTITRGSELIANGTASDPIIFSSDDEGYDGSGEWGGIIMHGYGLHNECIYNGDDEDDVDCNIDAEGESGKAGGHDNTDSSGSLQYVVVTEGGYEFSTGNEINGISFVAVGSGTTVENIQVNGNADDGVEFYGGAVSAKYLVLTGSDDDSIDWDEGWIGNIQHAIVIQAEGSGDNTIEADTEGTDDFLSEPTLMNVTFVSSGGSGSTAHTLKAGTGGYIHNSVIAVREGATLDFCTYLSGDSAQANATAGSIVYSNIVADCMIFETSNLETDATESTLLVSSGFSTNLNVVSGVTFNDNWGATNTEAAGLTAVDAEMFSPVVGINDFFDPTTYAGAIDPAATTAWWDGWIVEDSLSL